MSTPEALIRVRASSSDPDNPSVEELRRMVLETRTVAVVGLSRDPTKAARRVPSYMATKGYDLIPVNPFADTLLGKRARASLTEVSEPVDMVVVFRPSHDAGTVVCQAAARPERPVIWLQEGIRNDDAVLPVREAGGRVVQDLCFFKVHRVV